MPYTPRENRINKIKMLREEFPKYDIFSSSFAMRLHQTFLNEEVLQEFSEKTISIDKTLKVLFQRFDNNFKDAYIRNDEDIDENVIIVEFEKKQYDCIDNINTFLKSFGWIPTAVGDDKWSRENLEKNKSNFFIYIQYEANFDEEVDIHQDKLYHVTPDIRYEKIKDNGLYPKAQSKETTHPERVYLFIDKKDSTHVANALYATEQSKSKSLIKKMYVLEIDYKSIKDKIRLFDDPNYSKKGVYTTSVIPPKYIKAVGILTVK